MYQKHSDALLYFWIRKLTIPLILFFIFSVIPFAMKMLWNFVTFSLYLLATLLQNFLVRRAVDFKLWYFCQSYLIKFGYFLLLSISSKITLIEKNKKKTKKKIKLCLFGIVICPRCYLPHFPSTINRYLNWFWQKIKEI